MTNVTPLLLGVLLFSSGCFQYHNVENEERSLHCNNYLQSFNYNDGAMASELGGHGYVDDRRYVYLVPASRWDNRGDDNPESKKKFWKLKKISEKLYCKDKNYAIYNSVVYNLDSREESDKLALTLERNGTLEGIKTFVFTFIGLGQKDFSGTESVVRQLKKVGFTIFPLPSYCSVFVLGDFDENGKWAEISPQIVLPEVQPTSRAVNSKENAGVPK